MMEAKATLKVLTGQRGAKLGDLFGIFFEDLNHAADGGLYAELVQNRSFEFDPIDHKDYHALTAWEPVQRGNGQAALTVEDSHPLNERNLHYAVIDIVEEGDGVGIMNLGFNSGIPVTEGEKYKFSVYARRDTSFEIPLSIRIESAHGKVHGEISITVESPEWTKFEGVIEAKATDYSSRLVILAKGSGRVYLDMVSLFPEKTFLNRPGGLREDIAHLLAEMKPKFMRFPGGCLVHDGSLNPDDRDSMYRWKNTIGDVARRPARRNNWSYNQTLGLGYFEYFQFCEDIGAKAIPVLPGGYDPHHKRMVPLDELGPWIEDALDLIEFANGDTDTPWGGIRAGLGHPEPFGLEYVGIGNEEVGEPFFERYPYFHKAIKEKYPEIKVINSSGPFSAGAEYERGWASARATHSDLVDEHYYSSPEWFLANHHRYDNFKADEPKVFLGEYASWGNTYYNALVEAAFMTGLQNNAHAVGLACYAPMLCNADYVNWKPDMIWFNNHEVYGTANYYVQKLFMNHQGDQLLGVEAKGFAPPQTPGNPPITGAMTLAVDAASARFSDISLTNTLTGEVKNFGSDSAGIKVSKLPDPAMNGTDPEVFELGTSDWEQYTLKLKAVRTGGNKGFRIYFGKADDSNHLFWEIGGWQNQDSIITSIVKNRHTALTHTMFTVETDVQYDLTLEVTGRQIRSYINGELINETEDKLPVIEPLYYTASMEDETGDIILKTVNVQDQKVAGEIVLEGLPVEGAAIAIYELSGHRPEDENNFEQPALVSPKQHSLTITGSSFSYEFPEQSVTIFRISQR